MEALYQTTATSVNGRGGTVTVENSDLTFEMSPPAALGGNDGAGVNPEQLFAAGYAACFGSALQHVIRTKKLHIPLPRVQITVGIGKNETGGFALAADILGAFNGLNQEAADALMAEAHTVCPYSNATKGNMPVTLTAKLADIQ